MKLRVFGAGGAALAMALATLVAASGSVSAGAAGAAAPKPAQAASDQTVYPFSFIQPDGSMATVDAPPTRIVVVDNPEFSIDDLLALGVQPIGGELYASTAVQGLNTFKDVTLTNFKTLGTAACSPDLEAIAAAHPDLIVGVNGTTTCDYAQLKDIAPLADIARETSGVGHSGVQSLADYAEIELLAKILNRQAQANAFFATFAAAAAKVRPLLQGITFSYIVDLANNSYNQGGPDADTSELLEYMGLTVPPLPFPDAVEGFEVVSFEQAHSLTAQYVMVGFASAQSYTSDPVLYSVPAVVAHHLLDNGTETPFYSFPSVGVIQQLDEIPLFTKALLSAGTPPHHVVGTVGASGSLSSVNYNGYDGPLFTLSGTTYAQVSNPSVMLPPGTTLYGI